MRVETRFVFGAYPASPGEILPTHALCISQTSCRTVAVQSVVSSGLAVEQFPLQELSLQAENHDFCCIPAWYFDSAIRFLMNS